MAPFLATLLKELAKVAIPIIATKLVEGITSSENKDSSLKLLPSGSNDSYQSFNPFEISQIKSFFSQTDDIQTGLNNLIKNGFSYQIDQTDDGVILKIRKGLKELIIT